MKTKWIPLRGRFTKDMFLITEKGKPDTFMNYINYSVTPDTIKEAKPIQVRWLGHVYRKDESDPTEN